VPPPPDMSFCEFWVNRSLIMNKSFTAISNIAKQPKDNRSVCELVCQKSTRAAEERRPPPPVAWAIQYSQVNARQPRLARTILSKEYARSERAAPSSGCVGYAILPGGRGTTEARAHELAEGIRAQRKSRAPLRWRGLNGALLFTYRATRKWGLPDFLAQNHEVLACADL
jgi:hypothetical protein